MEEQHVVLFQMVLDAADNRVSCLRAQAALMRSFNPGYAEPTTATDSLWMRVWSWAPTVFRTATLPPTRTEQYDQMCSSCNNEREWAESPAHNQLEFAVENDEQPKRPRPPRFDVYVVDKDGVPVEEDMLSLLDLYRLPIKPASTPRLKSALKSTPTSTKQLTLFREGPYHFTPTTKIVSFDTTTYFPPSVTRHCQTWSLSPMVCPNHDCHPNTSLSSALSLPYSYLDGQAPIITRRRFPDMSTTEIARVILDLENRPAWQVPISRVKSLSDNETFSAEINSGKLLTADRIVISFEDTNTPIFSRSSRYYLTKESTQVDSLTSIVTIAAVSIDPTEHNLYIDGSLTEGQVLLSGFCLRPAGNGTDVYYIRHLGYNEADSKCSGFLHRQEVTWCEDSLLNLYLHMLANVEGEDTTVSPVRRTLSWPLTLYNPSCPSSNSLKPLSCPNLSCKMHLKESDSNMTLVNEEAAEAGSTNHHAEETSESETDEDTSESSPSSSIVATTTTKSSKGGIWVSPSVPVSAPSVSTSTSSYVGGFTAIDNVDQSHVIAPGAISSNTRLSEHTRVFQTSTGVVTTTTKTMTTTHMAYSSSCEVAVARALASGEMDERERDDMLHIEMLQDGDERPVLGGVLGIMEASCVMAWDRAVERTAQAVVGISSFWRRRDYTSRNGRRGGIF